MKQEPEDNYAQHAPRVGQRLKYKGKLHGTVRRVEGALCWVNYDDGSDPLSFIWCFHDGLNKLHDW